MQADLLLLARIPQVGQTRVDEAARSRHLQFTSVRSYQQSSIPPRNPTPLCPMWVPKGFEMDDWAKQAASIVVWMRLRFMKTR